jgi:alanine dehydrogenase
MMTDHWFDLPSFVLRLADKGAEATMRVDPDLLHGLNVYQGKVINLQVREDHGMAYSAPENIIAA